MIVRVLLLIAFAAMLAVLPGAAPARSLLPDIPGVSSKLLIYLAKGAPDSCGPGCDRWIAVEGTVDTEAAARVRQFLRGVKDTRLPFYFHSPGGDVRQAFAIGRMLRTRKATGRVGQTVAINCPGAQGDEACFKLKAGGGEIEARIVTRSAMCNSACGYLILGAVVREIPLDAAIAVHNTKILTEFSGHPTAAQRAQAVSRLADRSDSDRASFVAAMGIEAGLVDLIKTVKFESMHILTRPELYRFRIDTRPLVQTDWSFEASGRGVVRKRALAKRGDGQSFGMMEWRLYCEGRDRTRFMFLREIEKDDAVTTTVAITGGLEKPPAFGRYPARAGAFAVWTAVMTADDAKALFAAPRLEVGETDAVREGPPSLSVFEIETLGLEAAWTQLSARCAAGPGASSRIVAAPRSEAAPYVGSSSETFAAPGPGWGAFAPK